MFDGHGGSSVSKLCQDHFVQILQDLDLFKNKQYEEALVETFKQMDAKVQKDTNAAEFEGCTACVVLVTQTKIYCANAGDSRAVLFSNDKVVPLSDDHKPHLQKERQRIQDAEHSVFDDRVDGNLAVARAFGDFRYKDKKTFTWDK